MTVGTQLPFERLILAMDRWAAAHPEREVVVQSGETHYRPAHCRWQTFTSPSEWEAYFNRSSLVVSHAGMGTILKCLDRAKPLILMPRLARLGEHRNDHQLATAARFRDFPGLRVVDSADELTLALADPPRSSTLEKVGADNPNLQQLRARLREFADGK